MGIEGIWLAFGLMGSGTWLIRASFLLCARRLSQLPEAVRRPLEFVPAATLSALIAPAFIRPHGSMDPFGPMALAGLVAALISRRTQSPAATIAVGLVVAASLDRLL